ncbi:hypothetical protein HPSA50_1753 [Helicobacter pylori SouthAfrica50]|uniref:Uncharacterized protein n=1 Tax=Helicobacter pylori SouthAfrica50 TaxID=1352357 RepID=T2S9X9_HELPX|nr:hypothetical protein HPSA50_1753 [Helicobacter pylori SouthAfrica50]
MNKKRLIKKEILKLKFSFLKCDFGYFASGFKRYFLKGVLKSFLTTLN